MSAFFAHPLWTLIGFLGAGGTIIAVFGLILGWPVVLAFLNTKIGRIGVAIAAAVVAVAALMSKERAAGAAAERKRQEDENAAFLNRQAQGDQKRAGASDADLDRMLRDNGKPPAGQG